MNRTRIQYILLLALLAQCSTGRKDSMNTTDTTRVATATAVQPTLFTLTNSNNLKMTVTNFGGRIVSLWVPDRNGDMADIVLGYDSVNQYLNGNPYFGALIGRYGNRIGKGKFSIDGKEYSLATNNGENALHGGPKGFHNVHWDAKEVKTEKGAALELTYLSKDDDEGYPGNLTAKVTYTLTDSNELQIDYEATTDQPTIVNLTHHSFFNLAGEGNGDILGHSIMINADKFNPVDKGLIPTGELKPVRGTPFDFLKSHTIGERINQTDEQLQFGKGYDHNWVLNKEENEFSLAAKVVEPASGRVMEVWTTEPGLQFYSGNFLTDNEKGKAGKTYPFRSAFCLEAQHFPDSPNKADFPPVVLRPGEVYKQTTVYKFLAE